MSALVFLDFESTGLNPDRDAILEIGLLALEPVTLRELAAWSCPIKAPSAWQSYCDERVLQMHRDSGLHAMLTGPQSLLTLEAGGLPQLEEAEQWALQFLAPFGRSPMAGFNPSFDRAFARRWMPALERAFHYRNLDCNAFFLAEQYGLGLPGDKPPAAHRALADCRAAADRLRQWVARIRG